jgi:hypothetical protein
MADDSFEVEADSLDEARKLVQARVPDGQRAEIDVLCDGRAMPRVTREIRVTADSERMAQHLAYSQIPDGFIKVSERQLQEAGGGTAVAAADDEATACRKAKLQVPKGMVSSECRVKSREVERSSAYNDLTSDWSEAQRWIESLQASLGESYKVTNLRREPLVKRRFFGLLPFESKVFVAELQKTKRIEVEIPYRPPVELLLVVGTDFYSPKARVSARIVPDEAAAAELRSHPELVAALAALPVSDTNHDFFSERYDHDHDLYVAPSRDAFDTLGPVRMALRVVAFLGQRSFDGRRRVSSRWQVGGGMLVASFTTHYDDIPGSGNHVKSLLVLRVAEDKYTDFSGRFQKG